MIPELTWEFFKYKIFRFPKGYVNEQAEKRKTRRTALEKTSLQVMMD